MNLLCLTDNFKTLRHWRRHWAAGRNH